MRQHLSAEPGEAMEQPSPLRGPHPGEQGGWTEDLRERLLRWYGEAARDLPWRRTRDPYAVLVSEVMLQQTQVERVVPKYHDFLRRFPSLAALAAAPRAEVIRAWEGLGYNRRAVRLHEVAQAAVARHGGRLPPDPAALRALPGVGRYTANAVACFAFGRAVPVVDTNVRRVLGRVLLGEPDQATVAERTAWQLAEQLLPGTDAQERAGRDAQGTETSPAGGDAAYTWNQALMELGARVCVARAPLCPRCPLRGLCLARRRHGDGLANSPQPALAGFDDAGAGLLAAHPPAATAPARRRALRERRASYRPEGPFVGSRRYYRGRVVDVLRSLPAGASLSLAELGPRIKADWSPADLPWLHRLVADLVDDGLAVFVGAGGAGGTLAEERIALP